jgi:hypothetical protein
MRIGHPLARSICQQSLTRASGVEGAELERTELSKIAADEVLPQPAVINTAF